MYLLGLGIVLLLLKWLAVAPIAAWSWWAVLAPFGLAALWWTWSDLSGRTKRSAAQRIEARKAERLARQRDKLGLRPRRPR
ncbi:MAG TPA: TIGR04438 family Trp-rich protein [Pseudorhodoferax sp.]|jgi:small Trp-rich protein|nr:TIGR04438 family Trp-rich protein [Pseudorhodoferax sp.]